MRPGEALTLAKEELSKRRVSPLDVKGGESDCWAFIALYDFYLKEGKGVALPLNLSFSSPLGFYKEIRKLGFSSLEALADFSGYTVSSTPVNGDICYLHPFCASVYYDGYFYAPRERSILFEKIKYKAGDPSLLLIFTPKE